MEALRNEEFAPLSAESDRDFRRCFIEDSMTGRIRFTAAGFAEYGPRFARAGIDINRIRTRDALREACRRSDWVFADELRQMVKGHKVLEDVLKSLWP